MYIAKKEIAYLLVNNELLNKYFPKHYYNQDNPISYLDYIHEKTSEKYLFNKFEPYSKDYKVKLDTLFYYVYLIKESCFESDFLFGMKSIIPEECFPFNEKELLENKTFFLRYAENFYTNLYNLVIWRNSDLSDINICLIKNRNVHEPLPRVTIHNYPIDKRLIDKFIFQEIESNSQLPFINTLLYDHDVENISLEIINYQLDRVRSEIENNEKILLRFKKKHVDRVNDDKGVKRKKGKSTIYRGLNPIRVFQGYIYHIISCFIVNEGLIFENTTLKTEDNIRYRKLITYEFLAKLGIINEVLINQHTTISLKETYIANLPKWIVENN